MAEMRPLITIVGCGPGSPDYLTDAAKTAIAHADILVGAQRLLDLLPQSVGERIVVTARLDEVLDRMEATWACKRIAVLVTGDPGLFSLSRRVIDRFGREHCHVIPGISSMQVAFARLGLDWADAALVSVHKDYPEPDPILERADKIAIFCGRKGSLWWIKDKLGHLLCDGRKIFVAENLTLENERIRDVLPEEFITMDAAPRTIVIIVKESLLS